MSSEAGHRPLTDFTFLLIDDFTLMSFTAAVEPLRVANRMSGRDLYRWSTVSRDGQPVRASNGVRVQVDSSLAAVSSGDAVVACSGLNVYDHIDDSLIAQLRRLSRLCPTIGSVCTGSAVLAAAGLLDGYRVTVHWEDIDSLTENFPNLTVTRSLFELHGDRFTCSGGTAPIDLMLHFITRDFGRELSARVADQLLHHSARKPSEPQRLALSERTGARHGGLLDILAAMEDHLETPLSLTELAARGGVSVRQMERLFARELGSKPAHYYRNLRLGRARQMVRQTGLSMIEIAVATGFSSAPHFAKAYGALHGLPPSRDRALARGS
jgi:AraC family transcriptional regulator, glycine betaine-responsive activator